MVTACRRQAQAMHANEDCLGHCPGQAIESEAGRCNPGVLLGAIGTQFHHMDSLVFHRQSFVFNCRLPSKS